MSAVAHVVPDRLDAAAGTLVLNNRRFACALGRSGAVPPARKREGDGATPAGRFALVEGYYRADRLERPAAPVPLRPIAPGMGWCDAPGDPAYNRLVCLPYPAGAEALWRDDNRYDLLIVLDYNLARPVAGAGSAIFLHMTAPHRPPTEGCVALAPADLLDVMASLKAPAALEIAEPQV